MKVAGKAGKGGGFFLHTVLVWGGVALVFILSGGGGVFVRARCGGGC